MTDSVGDGVVDIGDGDTVVGDADDVVGVGEAGDGDGDDVFGVGDVVGIGVGADWRSTWPNRIRVAEPK